MGEKLRFVRPRVMLYGALIVCMMIGFVYLLGSRELSEFQITRTRGTALYSTLEQGRISNQFQIHISNKSKSEVQYSMRVLDNPNVELVVPIQPFPLKPQTMGSLPLFFNFPRELLRDGKKDIWISVNATDGFEQKVSVTLFGPEV